ncbi:hypothetical protein [Chitinimonas sp. BJYL2]|uniref:hypothetical protein n=1 Tax=Chitinimonas sp. BJYL2 TaxID=2976696 RepID=UPI0022B45FF1|nr:hypothetical protein [Chitinimonas sp. BJYL2]
MSEDEHRRAAEALFLPKEDWQRSNVTRETDTEKKIARLKALRELRDAAEDLASSRGMELDELLDLFATPPADQQDPAAPR